MVEQQTSKNDSHRTERKGQFGSVVLACALSVGITCLVVAQPQLEVDAMFVLQLLQLLACAAQQLRNLRRHLSSRLLR